MKTELSVFQALVEAFIEYSGIAGLHAKLQQRQLAISTNNHFQHVISLAAAAEPVASPEGEGSSNALPISFVVPVFNTRAKYLDDLLASFLSQQSGLSELVLSDDGSTADETKRWLEEHAGARDVTIVRNLKNRGIAAATNSAIASASGQWIGLLDHDDALAPFVVARVVETLRQRPECRFLYTDEVIADRMLRPVSYFLKPAWDPVLLSGVNYANHLSLYRRDRLLTIGGLREDFEGSQDYDLVLRYTADLLDGEILHLPYPGYIWRRDNRSYSVTQLPHATRNARKALAERYRSGVNPIEIDEAVTANLHRVRFDAGRSAWPLVTVVIPSINSLALISTVLDGLVSKTDYPTLEIVVVDNGTTDPDVVALYERYRQGSIPFRALINKEPFNFSRAVNRGIDASRAEYVLLLNNDVEIIESQWLKEMMSCFAYPRVGIVGAKLLYPDRTIQHAGVIAGLGGLAGHWFIGHDEDYPGPMGRLWVRQSLSAVTGACMLISRECLDQVGAFDEERFAVAYNDIDYCLRAVKAGYRIVWTPFATLIHHESATRGSDEVPEHIKRFEHDKDSLRAAHATQNFEDRAFNPWLSKHRSDPASIELTALPPAR